MKLLISHKLYLMSKIRKYITVDACIAIFKTMILSLIEYGDVVYNGTSQTNLNVIDKLFYRGLRICLNNNIYMTKDEICAACKITNLQRRLDCHVLLFMHKLKSDNSLLKSKTVYTRLHDTPVFNTYKPNNEKVKNNLLYKGAIKWNELAPAIRNLDFKEFKIMQKKALKT